MIHVTKTYLPPLEEYTEYLQGIWARTWITNYGPLVLELEQKLKNYLGVKHVFLVSNGTIALQIAIKALELEGEIITTPFSYVATTSSIVWEGCKPIFADIQRDTLCLDPQLIEQLITPRTSAVLATHVYGNPCDVEAIEIIAQKHQLKIVYDAAHAFGVQYKGQSVLNFGDVSTLSFHATKLFHTGEGGAIITNDDQLAHKIGYMANFGHNGPERYWGLGINGKNSELHAAMGLCVLPKVTDLIRRREEISKQYDQLLHGLGLVKPMVAKHVVYNYAYYPIIFPNEEVMLAVIAALNAEQIFPRRYFYPSLNELNYIDKQSSIIAEDISSRVMCLPLYYDLSVDSVLQIASIIKNVVIQ
ncbi:DegT/DnrJ/EryC1/StrS family aminotransferase [Hymenobacter sp. HDW8]|uniref:DegT/DnrJ/EryC1/StrS family aminotransferase n=1 Tax=Hymenobacter sp. HDW8 TaxID=2714932 RepID=UPI0014095A21|nr:DegT/DnrJ/EryC1/StrS family aminotransferase [Hymenobacter sp. HDW8]QIL76403.1 DegT/DnrJ/EryC1/StrS family aminotransferase [Hymenobacter sp. HDW8]